MQGIARQKEVAGSVLGECKVSAGPCSKCGLSNAGALLGGIVLSEALVQQISPRLAGSKLCQCVSRKLETL